jgi:hypothetical protein
VAVALTVILWSCGTNAADAGKASGQSIIVTTPKDETAGADVNLLGTGKYGGNASGQGSLLSPDMLSSQGSLSGLMAPPQPGPSSVIRGGNMGNLLMLDPNRDWMFMSPEELILGLTPQEAAVLQGSNSRGDSQNDNNQGYLNQSLMDQSLSPAARFYQSLARQQNGNQRQKAGLNQQGQGDLFGASQSFFNVNAYRMQDSGLQDDFGSKNGDSSLAGVAINASGLQNALNSVTPAQDTFPSSDTRSQPSNPFALGQGNQTGNDGFNAPAPNDYVAQFKALLNPQTPAAPVSTPAPNPFGDTTSEKANAGLATGFGIVAAPAQVKTFNPQWSNPALPGSTIPTVGATVDSQPDLGQTRSSVGVNMMQPQTFSVPKRWF